MKKRVVLFVLLLVGMAAAVNLFAQELTNPELWYSYDDKNDGGSSTCNLVTQKEKVGGVEKFAITMTGVVTKKFQYGFIGIGYTIDAATKAKIVKANKLKFKVIGDGKMYKVRFDLTTVKDFDHPLYVFSTKKGQVVEISVSIKAFKQEGWGKKVAFKPEHIEKMAFQTVGQPIPSVSLKIFDIRFE